MRATPTIPDKLWVALHGMPGEPFVSVELADGAVRYSNQTGDSQIERTFTPSARQWSAFRRLLERWNVWNWQPHYKPDLLILDGTHWTWNSRG